MIILNIFSLILTSSFTDNYFHLWRLSWFGLVPQIIYIVIKVCTGFKTEKKNLPQIANIVTILFCLWLPSLFCFLFTVFPEAMEVSKGMLMINHSGSDRYHLKGEMHNSPITLVALSPSLKHRVQSQSFCIASLNVRN